MLINICQTLFFVACSSLSSSPLSFTRMDHFNFPNGPNPNLGDFSSSGLQSSIGASPSTSFLTLPGDSSSHQPSNYPTQTNQPLEALPLQELMKNPHVQSLVNQVLSGSQMRDKLTEEIVNANHTREKLVQENMRLTLELQSAKSTGFQSQCAYQLLCVVFLLTCFETR